MKKMICFCAYPRTFKDLLVMFGLGAVTLASVCSSRAESTVAVDYQVADTWNGGFKAEVVISNAGPTEIDGWTLSFDLPVTIDNSWSVTVDPATTATRKVFTHGQYNGDIAPGEAVDFGFTADGDPTPDAGNILFNGQPPMGSQPALVIDSVSLDEGDVEHAINVAVALTAPMDDPVSVNWATADGTATAGEDYTANSGSLLFAAGETQKLVSITILGDEIEEANETFGVVLSQAGGAMIAVGEATVEVINDDFTPSFSVSSASAFESDTGTNSTIEFTIRLDVPAEAPATVDYSTADQTATAGADYAAASGTVSFGIGESEKTVSVTVYGDTEEEMTERFLFTLSNPTEYEIDIASATGTIHDNDGANRAHGKYQYGAYNYAEALQKSMYFYDVQRSGDLPDNYRIEWRGDSALDDGSDVGLDLSGGFYDAGDHLKFGLPMAYSFTMLSWGAIEYPEVYAETGQEGYLLDTLQYGMDYLMRCHVRNPDGSTKEFYGQVGEGDADHSYWGPPENMTMDRPSMKIDAAHPGTDLAAETAASMAAVSILFAESDPTFATELIDHAEALYDFADTYRGYYHHSITNAAKFYKSWGYEDELIWGALWLYRATGKASYLNKAKTEYTNMGYEPYDDTLSWDGKMYGAYVLLSLLDGGSSYRAATERWLNHWSDPVNGMPHTPDGLSWLREWGPLRYSANTAFCSLLYADKVNDPDGKYSTYGKEQIHYMLGDNDNNRSFVCGFGVNPPTKPHHRSMHGSTTDNIHDPVESLHVLYGALVGGPALNGTYADTRPDYQQNEVAMDYNAGFTCALVALYSKYGGYTLADIDDPTTPRKDEEELPDDPEDPEDPPEYAVQRGEEFDVSAANRLPADEMLHDWSRAGYREDGVLPGSEKRTHWIDATTFGLVADDGQDDSAALQAAIDSAAALARDYDHLAVIELPSGTIHIGKQIDLHVSFTVIKGQEGDPLQSNTVTRLVFEPDADTRYDKVSGDVPDFNAMSHDGCDMDWIWPGRGLLKVQTLAVHEAYNSSYSTAPENRKDIFEGSVNFHWKAGLDVLQNGGLVAAAGSTVIPLDDGIPSRKLDVLSEGMYIVVKSADSEKMYQEQGVAPGYWKDLFMKMQMFRLVAVDLQNRTITLDRPLEFDLYANSVADGSSVIDMSDRTSRVVPLDVVEGVGIEDLFITHPVSGRSAADAAGNYSNLSPENALHGIVFKWAVNCWVRGVHTYMTGSHAVVTEEAKNIQIEGNVFQGSWNKGAGGNGYFRCSRLWDSLIHNNTLQDLRHLTLQWSSSGNVVIGNHLDCDINFHGGWERFNLVEQNTGRVSSKHRNDPSSQWYPVWWATGPKAGKWSGASGPRNVLFNNDLSKQASDGAAYDSYCYGNTGAATNLIFQFGWDRDTESGSYWVPLGDQGGMLQDWSGSETVDFSKDPYEGVNALQSPYQSSAFLMPMINSYQNWAISYFGREAIDHGDADTAEEANPDGDALSNLAEYAFAGNPAAKDDVGILIQVNGDSMNLDFPFNRYATDLSYELMSSTNLIDWVVVHPDSYSETVGSEHVNGNNLFRMKRLTAPISPENDASYYKIRAQYTP